MTSFILLSSVGRVLRADMIYGAVVEFGVTTSYKVIQPATSHETFRLERRQDIAVDIFLLPAPLPHAGDKPAAAPTAEETAPEAEPADAAPERLLYKRLKFSATAEPVDILSSDELSRCEDKIRNNMHSRVAKTKTYLERTEKEDMRARAQEAGLSGDIVDTDDDDVDLQPARQKLQVNPALVPLAPADHEAQTARFAAADNWAAKLRTVRRGLPYDNLDAYLKRSDYETVQLELAQLVSDLNADD